MRLGFIVTNLEPPSGADAHMKLLQVTHRGKTSVYGWGFSKSKGESVSKPNAAGAAELKLNIGCGISGIEGWVNIDNSPTILLSRLPLGRQIFRTPRWPGD